MCRKRDAHVCGVCILRPTVCVNENVTPRGLCMSTYVCRARCVYSTTVGYSTRLRVRGLRYARFLVFLVCECVRLQSVILA